MCGVAQLFYFEVSAAYQWQLSKVETSAGTKNSGFTVPQNALNAAEARYNSKKFSPSQVLYVNTTRLSERSCISRIEVHPFAWAIRSLLASKISKKCAISSSLKVSLTILYIIARNLTYPQILWDRTLHEPLPQAEHQKVGPHHHFPYWLHD